MTTSWIIFVIGVVVVVGVLVYVRRKSSKAVEVPGNNPKPPSKPL